MSRYISVKNGKKGGRPRFDNDLKVELPDFEFIILTPNQYGTLMERYGYELLYKALNRISDSAEKKDMLIAAIKFQLKMLLIMGFCVELDTCLCCRSMNDLASTDIDTNVIDSAILCVVKEDEITALNFRS